MSDKELRTYQVKSMYVNKSWLIDKIEAKFDKIAQEVNKFLDEIKPILDKRFIDISNKNVWLDRDAAGLYPNSNFELRYFRCDYGGYDYLNSHKDVSYEDLDFHIPSEYETNRTFHQNNDRCYFAGNFVSAKRWNNNNSNNIYRYCFINSNGDYYTYSFNNADSNYHFNSSYATVIIPIHRLRGKELSDYNSSMSYIETITALLKNKLVAKGLNKEQAKKFLRLCDLYALNKSYFKHSGENIKLNIKLLKHNILEGNFEGSVFGEDFSLGKFLSGEKKITLEADEVKQELLECDWKRFNFVRYDEGIITDNNRGHWELAEQGDEDTLEAALPDSAVWNARPPRLDVIKNGICAIDFGTKSTVVVLRSRGEKMLRVGKGDYTSVPTMEDYENPTAVKFLDIESFEKSYAGRIGRPFTRWADQVVVSHEAVAELKDTDDSSIYSSIFRELKQWANDRERRLNITDRAKPQHHTIELKPYLELGEDDIDPIEIYAYYLGLYINNMVNSICLKYILSFPVNYAKDVRDKLLQSFTKGLKKSLPPALIKDESIKFKVYAGASEPAAYAIRALREFHLEPKEVGKTVPYAVFDFGGGTTDFDFGYEEIPANRRYKFAIHQFGKGGDVYLGGENLLDLLAYEVYKDNIEEMRTNKIPFALPPTCDSFAGSERLVLERGRASQEAYMNTKRIAELLRPIWEKRDDYRNQFESQPATVTLFSSKSQTENRTPIDLKVDVDKLEKKIEERIDEGIVNFFTALNKAFNDNLQNIQLPINIFLAGNSCKSPIVKKLFEQHIKETEQNFNQFLQRAGKKAAEDTIFTLYLPLGMKEEAAQAESEEKDGAEDEEKTVVPEVVPEKDTAELDRRLTGKTGVAFGLLRTRDGAKDVKIINKNVDESGEMTFPYLLGKSGDNDIFEAVINFNTGYNEWHRFTYADEDSFELYYTSQAKALDGNMSVEDSNIDSVDCEIDEDDVVDEDDEDTAVYIRKTAPNKIEYAVGTEADFKADTLTMKIYSKILD